MMDVTSSEPQLDGTDLLASPQHIDGDSFGPFLDHGTSVRKTL